MNGPNNLHISQKGISNLFQLLFFTWLIINSSLVVAQPVRISSALDSSEFRIGDWIKIHVSIEHPAGVNVLWSNPLKYDSSIFKKISESSVDSIHQSDFTTENRTIIVTAYDTGTFRSPSLTYYYRQNEQTDSVTTAPLTVYITPVAVDTSKSFRDIKPSLITSSSSKNNWLYLAAAIFLLLAVVIRVYLFLKKRNQKSAVTGWVDTRLPHEIASEKISLLNQENNLEDKNYFTRITEILREYIEHGLQLPAFEDTTREMIASLKKRIGDEDLLKQLERNLIFADHVKFAKAPSSNEDRIQITAIINEFIDKTKPSEVQQREVALSMIQFANPTSFWLLTLVPLLILAYAWRQIQQRSALRLSTIDSLKSQRSTRVWMRHSLLLLRLITFVALIIALARPQITLAKKTIASEGVDIVLAFDISGSMLTRDFVPSRLDVAKKVATDFIDGRPNDRIGVVFFAAQAYTGCPITTDHKTLKSVIENVKAGSLEDGTAIGMGLGTAATRLKENSSGSKIIILMTDGENNAGTVKPLEAAQLVKSMGIHLYCIGIISPESELLNTSEKPVQGFQSPSAEVVLMQMAEIAGGKYFRANNEKKLEDIYEEINQLEKTKVDVTTYDRYKERFYIFAIIAAFALLTEVLLRYTVFKTIP